MKIILLEDVKKVGKKDEVVEVSQGYATNVLIKQGKALEYTKGNKKHLDEELDQRQKDFEKQTKNNQKIKEQLEKIQIAFSLQKGANGLPFGTISSKQVAEKLKELGYDIDKKHIIMEPIKSFGFNSVDVYLQKEVVAKLNIYVEEK